jgi:hypothetical protein
MRKTAGRNKSPIQTGKRANAKTRKNQMESEQFSDDYKDDGFDVYNSEDFDSDEAEDTVKLKRKTEDPAVLVNMLLGKKQKTSDKEQTPTLPPISQQVVVNKQDSVSGNVTMKKWNKEETAVLVLLHNGCPALGRDFSGLSRNWCACSFYSQHISSHRCHVFNSRFVNTFFYIYVH